MITFQFGLNRIESDSFVNCNCRLIMNSILSIKLLSIQLRENDGLLVELQEMTNGTHIFVNIS